MVRLGISVEGTTEDKFAKQVLAPYLLTKGIELVSISLKGKVNIDRIKLEIGNMIYSFDYVTTLYDFYGFRRKAADDDKISLENKILETLEPALRHKLIPYVQMYEFEGLLFTSPEAIATVLKDDKLVKWAQDILRRFDGNPEAVNDSPQTAPSKRFEAYTRYSKTTHGAGIAKEIGIDTIRESCQGFDDWLTRIEAITQ